MPRGAARGNRADCGPGEASPACAEREILACMREWAGCPLARRLPGPALGEGAQDATEGRARGEVGMPGAGRGRAGQRTPQPARAREGAPAPSACT